MLLWCLPLGYLLTIWHHKEPSGANLICLLFVSVQPLFRNFGLILELVNDENPSCYKAVATKLTHHIASGLNWNLAIKIENMIFLKNKIVCFLCSPVNFLRLVRFPRKKNNFRMNFKKQLNFDLKTKFNFLPFRVKSFLSLESIQWISILIISVAPCENEPPHSSLSWWVFWCDLLSNVIC